MKRQIVAKYNDLTIVNDCKSGFTIVIFNHFNCLFNIVANDCKSNINRYSTIVNGTCNRDDLTIVNDCKSGFTIVIFNKFKYLTIVNRHLQSSRFTIVIFNYFRHLTIANPLPP
jgi:hypothetical protein